KRSKSRALRIIFVCSLHTGPGADPNVAWTLDGIYEAIDKLTGQGVELAVYNPLDVGGGYEALHELARENPRLTYNSAIHPEELLKVIAGHDFLWLCREVPPCPAGYHETHLPLTLFQAVAAGTPVIVSPELKYLCRIVERNNLGFSLAHDAWSRAREVMEAFDFERSRRDIEAFRRDLAPGPMALRLGGFFRSLDRGSAKRGAA
ncbi:MAG: hypothetical protein PHV85_09935, partial [Desulfovibrionaceae bacterium]|nr:hypothetical protein [Desulfovibrionaceae bacterium]